MHDYLFHTLSPMGVPVADTIAAFADDSAAIAHALSPAFPHGCELWRNYRLLGRFCGPAVVQTEPAAASLAA